MRKYKFEWELLGDIEKGRPNLGDQVGLETYRLALFTMRDAIESRYGAEEADAIFFDAGAIAGGEFYDHYIAPVSTLEEFVSKTQQTLKEKRIGLLRIEEAEPEAGRILLTVDEDVDCSGMPETNFQTCMYDEGFISALISRVTGEQWVAKEVDCWCTGARTCRFLVNRQV